MSGHSSEPLKPPAARLVKVKAAAAYLGISQRSLRELVAEGHVRAIFGKWKHSAWRFDLRELDRYADSLTSYQRKFR
jgi:excisionase family DNA binding protein